MLLSFTHSSNLSTVQKKETFKTILVIVTGLLVFSWIFNIVILWKIAAVVGVTSVLFPFVARWIEWAWLKLAFGMGWVNSRVLLSIIYFVFLLPIAWLSRLFTKDPLMLKARNAATVYTTRDHEYTKQDLENIW